MKITFMGTPEIAVFMLDALVKKYGAEGVSVVTSPDKPRGRSMKMGFSAVKEYALERTLPLYQPENLKRENFEQTLKTLDPDIIVVAAYGKILPQYVLEYPKFGCVNVHASLLPAYRGAAPINRCIMDGAERTGVTIMKMDKGLDTGDILSAESTEIGENETAGELYDRLCVTGAGLLTATLDELFAGRITPVKQDDSKACYAEKITADTQNIDFTRPPEEICRLIRGLSPYPAALTRHRESGKIVKIFRAVPASDVFRGEPGEVVRADKKLEIACGGGSIYIEELAMEGAKRMTARDFVNGRRAAKGDVFVCSLTTGI